mgnify:CR=1 FL=1
MKIPEIPEKRQYWLFRAGEKARYFNYFRSKKQIGLGWDKIEIEDDIVNLSRENLKEYVKTKYPEEEKPGGISNKIYTFMHEIKKGDIILMPNIEKVRVAFGQVMDDEIRIERTIQQQTLFPVGESNIYKTDPGVINKFRNVNWIKTVPKEELSSKLLIYLFSPHSISKLSSNISYEIEKTLNDVFILDDKIYIKFEVKTKDGIDADDYFKFYKMINLVEKISSDILNKKVKLQVKTNVSSPGDIMLYFSLGFGTIIIIMLFSFLSKSKTKIDFDSEGFHFESETKNGLLDYLRFIYDRKDKNNKFSKYKKEIQEVEEEVKDIPEKWDLKIPDFINKK